MTNLENQLQCTSEFVPKALKQLFFVLIVFITPENMSCVHVKQYMLGVSENSACTFHIRWNESVTFQGQLNDSFSKDRLQRPISPFLEVGLEKFFDSHLWHNIGKLKMIMWN